MIKYLEFRDELLGLGKSNKVFEEVIDLVGFYVLFNYKAILKYFQVDELILQPQLQQTFQLC